MTTTSPPPANRVPPAPRQLADPNFFHDVPHLAAASEKLAPRIPDLAVRHATVLFGESALVPLLLDGPAPDPTLSHLTPAERLSTLSRNPFGVLCGAGPNPIGALLLPERVLGPFLRDNPVITESALFWNSSSLNVACFVRSPALPPASLGVPQGPGWISGGKILPVCERDSRSPLACLQPLPVRKIALAELNWNALPDLGMEIMIAEIAAQHGPELLPGRGLPRLNPAFWAALYQAQLRIQFDPIERVFRSTNSGDCEVSEAVIQMDLTRLLHAHSQRPNCQALLHYREPRHLRRIVVQLKLFASQTPPPQSSELAAFLARSLSACPGATVTAEELYRAYLIFCTLHRLAPLAEPWFARASTRWIKTVLQVAKSHSIMRDGTARRGFRDVLLAPPA